VATKLIHYIGSFAISFNSGFVALVGIALFFSVFTAEAKEDTGGVTTFQGAVDNRHRVVISGTCPQSAKQIVADELNVRCKFLGNTGRFRCRGLGLALEPGLTITATCVEPGAAIAVTTQAAAEALAASAKKDKEDKKREDKIIEDSSKTAQADALPDIGGVKTFQGAADNRHRVVISGTCPQSANQIVADELNVRCKFLGNTGRFRCRGLGLEQGSIITATCVEPGAADAIAVANAASAAATAQAEVLAAAANAETIQSTETADAAGESVCTLATNQLGVCFAEEIPALALEIQAQVFNDLSGGATHLTAPHEAMQGAFEGYNLNTDKHEADKNLNQSVLQNNGGLDIPTGAGPSPLFGAKPFTQQMLRFEEFGNAQLGDYNDVEKLSPLPYPTNSEWPTDQDWFDLDGFLSQYINESVDADNPFTALPYPYPTRWANDPDHPDPHNVVIGNGTNENPWKKEIETYLGRPLLTPPAEGRPPGEEWAHQRWNEFFPQKYFVTAQAGARNNGGGRDRQQKHGYISGEFGEQGLYHTVYKSDATGASGALKGSTKGLPVQFHPNMPKQDPKSLWTFDGTLPPKLLMGRYGESVLMRHYNTLPIDPTSNMGFGSHTLSTHEHNGHNPSESDGYTQSFFFPGQYYDYHWPMILAGHDTINKDATDPRNGTPDGNGGIKKIPGDWHETMSTHWFHDHMLDFTATNVYKGNAAMMNYYSAIDRGREPSSETEAMGDSGYGCHYANPENVNLCLPSGSANDWGNRDYDINLFIKGIAWDPKGQLWFNIFNTDGMLGDQMVTNWLYKPYMEVRARRYRFRMLNGAVSRYIKVALVEKIDGSDGELAGPPGSGESYNRVPFYMIANDGNIMEHAVYFDGNKTVAGYTNRKGILPTQSIAERYDIIVDFAQFKPGTKLYMVNLLEHKNGRRPNREIPLQDVLNESYAPKIKNGRNTTDTTVTKFMEFRVNAYEGIDRSMDPADYVEGGKKMIPMPGFTEEELANAVHREFKFGRSNGTDGAPWTIKTDGGAGYNMDPRRLSAAPNVGEDGAGNVEIWHLKSGGGWSHPIHVHFEEGQILKRGGGDPPEWEKWSRKDVYRIGRMDDSTLSVDFAIRFREFMGSYMEHCHNTQHEDHAMLLRWDIEHPGQVKTMPTPMPSWDGVGYVPTYSLPTFRTGDKAP